MGLFDNLFNKNDETIHDDHPETNDVSEVVDNGDRIPAAVEYFSDVADPSAKFINCGRVKDTLLDSITHQYGVDQDDPALSDGSLIAKDYMNFYDTKCETPEDFVELLKPYNERLNQEIDQRKATLDDMYKTLWANDDDVDIEKMKASEDKVAISDGELLDFATVAFHGFDDGQNPSGSDLIDNAVDNMYQAYMESSEDFDLDNGYTYDVFSDAMASYTDYQSVNDYLDSQNVGEFVKERQKHHEKMKDAGVTNKVQSKEVEDDLEP